MTRPNNNQSPSPPERNESELPATRGRIKPFKILLRIVKIFLLTTLLLVALVLFTVFFLPLNVLKAPALSYIREHYGVSIQIADIDFSPISGIEINRLRIDPPEGFTKPLFKVQKIRLSYSLNHLFDNEFQLSQLLIDRPHINIETIDGVMNVVALQKQLEAKLENSASEADTEIEVEEEKQEPSTFRVKLANIEVHRFSAWADTGDQKVNFQALSLHATGRYSETDSHLDCEVFIDSEPDSIQLALLQQQPLPFETNLLMELKVKAVIDNFIEPRIALNLTGGIQSKLIQTEWKLEPVDLQWSLRAIADLQQQQATLSKFALRFNENDLLNVKATLQGIQEPKSLDLLLDYLTLPLDVLNPYIRAFQPDLDVGGKVRVENLSVQGEIPKLLAQGLPTLNGKVKLENIRATYRPAQASIHGLNADFDLKTRPGDNHQEKDDPALLASGNLTLNKATTPQGSLNDLNLSLHAQADGLELTDVQTKLLVAIPEVFVQSPEIGQAQLSFSLDTEAGGNLKTGQFTLEHADINLADVLSLHCKAQAELDQNLQAVRSHRFELSVDPIDLPKALRSVPAGIKKQMPELELGGNLAMTLETSGAIPFANNDPMRWPLKMKSSASLTAVWVRIPEQTLSISGIGSQVLIEGNPRDLRMESETTLKKLEKSDIQFSLHQLVTPLSLHLTPTEVKAKLGIDIQSMNKLDQALELKGLQSENDIQLTGDFMRALMQTIQLNSNTKLKRLRYAKDTVVSVENQSVSMNASFEQATRNGKAQVLLSTGKVDLPEQQMALQDFTIDIQTALEGLLLPTQADAQPTCDVITTQAGIKIGELEKRDLFLNPLLNTFADFHAEVRDLSHITHTDINAGVPSIGLTADMNGEIRNLKDAKGVFVDFGEHWPEFDMELAAELSVTQRKQLLEGLSLQGMTGIKARLRSLPQAMARFEGNLTGKDFCLWLNQKVQPPKNKPDEPVTITDIQVQRFNADVPIIQLIDMQHRRLVSKQGDIFEEKSRGVLHDTMRRYLKQQSNFRLDSLLYRKSAGSSTQQFRIDEINLDMLYSDNTFAIDRMYVDILGGGITGALQVQLTGLPPAPFDARIHFENQITGVNLKRLTERDPKKITADTELSMLTDLNVDLGGRRIDGRVDLTKLSLKQLDELFKFLDPSGQDPSIQNNRNLINAWYVNMLNPRIKLVSLWMTYGNLNMDIEMNALVFENLLQQNLDANRIRRYDVMPLIRDFVPMWRDKPEQTTALTTDQSTVKSNRSANP